MRAEDGAIGAVDAYEVLSLDGEVREILFLSMYHPRKSRKVPRGYTYANGLDPNNLTYGVNHIVEDFSQKLDAHIRKWQMEMLGVPLPVNRVREAINGWPLHPSVLNEVESADIGSPGPQVRDDILKLMHARQDPRFEGQGIAIGTDGLVRPLPHGNVRIGDVTEWFVGRNGQTIGPMMFDQLTEATQRGEVSRDDWVWQAGMDAWTAAGNIQGLWGPPPLLTDSVVRPPLSPADHVVRGGTSRGVAAKVLPALIGALSIPISILNFGGGIVGAVWLGLIGEWRLVGIGLAAIVVSMLMISFALMPALLFQGPALFALSHGRRLMAGLLMALGNLWDIVVAAVWCFGAFTAVLSHWSHGSAWPYLLWGYALSTGPWTYFAAREPGNADPDSPPSAGMIAVFSACVGTMAMMGLVLLSGKRSPEDLIIALSIPLLIGYGAGCALGLAYLRHAERV